MKSGRKKKKHEDNCRGIEKSLASRGFFVNETHSQSGMISCSETTAG